MDRPYAAIHFRDLNAHWNYTRRATWVEGSGDQYKPKHFKTNAEELAVAMTRNDSLYAMVVTGYYDLLLTPAQAKYATEQAAIPWDRLILEPVEAGHMPSEATTNTSCRRYSSCLPRRPVRCPRGPAAPSSPPRRLTHPTSLPTSRLPRGRHRGSVLEFKLSAG